MVHPAKSHLADAETEIGLRDSSKRARRLYWWTLVLAGAFVPAGHRWSPPAALRLGVRWSLVDVCGLQVSYLGNL